ncbi:MAG: response regulator [Gemmatimonadetes bacterium]|nr:response regulator [Gemmatimonadota bacterium]
MVLGPALRWAAALGIVGALGAAAYTGYRLIGTTSGTTRAVVTALKVEAATRRALGIVSDLASDRRSFELTRNSRYLDDIDRDHERMVAALNMLRDDVADAPALSALVDSAQNGIGAWVDVAVLPAPAQPPTPGARRPRELLRDTQASLRAILAAAERDEREGERAMATARARARWLWLVVTLVATSALLALANAAYRWQARVHKAVRELDLLLSAMPFTLLSLDLTGRIRQAPGRSPGLLGLTRRQLAGRRLADLVSASDREEIELGFVEALHGAQVEVEALSQAEDGAPRCLVITLGKMEDMGDGVGVSAVVRDVSAERALQTQVVQQERLASVGSLVAGVAHELNNPLSAIATFATVISRRALEVEDRNSLDAIVAEAQRSAKIVRNLLDFSRQRAHQHEPTNLALVIERTVTLRRYELRSARVDLAVDVPPDLPGVLGDGQELQQVFLNLLVNAEHAVRGRPEPRIRIEARAPSAGVVRVVVEDNGPGIPDDKLQLIFEPFYSTKPKGEGTGLGLSLSRGIVKEHHGELRAEHAEGGGAHFVVELPALAGVAIPATPVPRRVSIARPTPTGPGAHVLVVDDEPANRNALSRLLQRLGYRVSAAGDGREALQLLEREPVACVLSDVHMPVLDGAEMYEAIVKRWPELATRVVFMSGDSAADASVQRLAERGCPVLQKPFELDDVKKILQRMTAPSAA